MMKKWMGISFGLALTAVGAASHASKQLYQTHSPVQVRAKKSLDKLVKIMVNRADKTGRNHISKYKGIPVLVSPGANVKTIIEDIKSAKKGDGNTAENGERTAQIKSHDSIEQTLKAVVDGANSANTRATTNFHGMEIVAVPGDTVQSVMERIGQMNHQQGGNSLQ